MSYAFERGWALQEMRLHRAICASLPPHHTGRDRKEETLIMYRNLSCKNNKIFFRVCLGI